MWRRWRQTLKVQKHPSAAGVTNNKTKECMESSCIMYVRPSSWLFHAKLMLSSESSREKSKSLPCCANWVIHMLSMTSWVWSCSTLGSLVQEVYPAMSCLAGLLTFSIPLKYVIRQAASISLMVLQHGTRPDPSSQWYGLHAPGVCLYFILKPTSI